MFIQHTVPQRECDILYRHGDVHGYTLCMQNPQQHHITPVPHGNGEDISLHFSEY